MDAGPCDKDPRFPFLRDGKLEAILTAWKLRSQLSDAAVGTSLRSVVPFLPSHFQPLTTPPPSPWPPAQT